MTATTVSRERSATPTLATVRWLLRALVDILAEPVRKGRLRGESWHPGLRAAVAFSLVIYAAELALLATAPLVRAHDDLGVVGTMSLPRSTVFFFVAVVLWCLSLLYAASLHAPVWLRLGALLLVTLTMATFSIMAGTAGGAWVPVAVGVAALLVLTVVRWRRDPAWWEVPLSLFLVSAPSLVAVALGSARMQSLGADGMPLLLSLQMQRLNALAMPAALVAGAAIAELAAFNRDGQALGDLNERLLTPTNVTWFRILVGLVLLVMAARLARRGPPARALLLGQIGLVLVVIHLATVSDGRIRWPWTFDAVVDVAAVAALVGFAWLVLRGRLTALRAAVLGTIVVVPWAFRFSDVIDAPFVTLLGLGGVGVTLFGLVWAFATGATDANGDSSRYPRQTRVLLFLAQAVYGLLALVYAGVARGGYALAFSPTDTSDLGAQVVGVPLILAALVVTVWRLGSRRVSGASSS